MTIAKNLGTDVEVVSGLTTSDRVLNLLASGDQVRVATEQASACAEVVAAPQAREQWMGTARSAVPARPRDFPDITLSLPATP